MSTTFETFFDSIQGEANAKGEAFEKAVKLWFSNDQEWRGFFEEVFLWSEWPLAETRDLGIDLVAVDKTGRYWAIQTKAYDPDSSLKKSDVNSFISASSTPLFAGRILVTTTKTLGPNLKATLASQEKETRVVSWYDLVATEYDWTQQSTQVKPFKSLWRHQRRAVEAVSASLPKEGRGQLIMACGTGKTLTSIRISERLKSELTVVVVPSISLISQSISDWSKDASEAFSWWAVCSDETVGERAESEEFLAFDLSKPSSTNEDSLVRFLQMRGRKVIFTTYHSSDVVSRAIVKAQAVIDLAIFDEAHRLAGRVSEAFTSLLDQALPIKMRLFQTATPKLFKKYNLKTGVENLALSMDEEQTFGKVLYRYSFGQAIEDGKLRDFKVLIFVVTDEDLKEEIGNRELIKVDEKILDYRALAANFGVIKAMLKYDLRSTITFHSRVKWAADFSTSQELLWTRISKSSRQLESLTITGKSSASQRKARLKALDGASSEKFVQVTNARCLSEGIDVPDLDAVVFVDPKASKVDITQAVGRAIRKGSGRREFGYVVLPIFLSQEEVADGVFEPAQFAATLDVLNSLKSHDEQFEDLLVRTRLGKISFSGGEHNLPKIVIDSAKPLPPDFYQNVETAILDGVTSRWYGNYLGLKKLADSGVNIRGDIGRKKGYKTLHSWAGTQRLSYAKGGLDEEQIDLLNEIPNWFWSDKQVFEEGFEEFLRYLEAGGALLPSEEITNVAAGIKMRSFARRVLKLFLDQAQGGLSSKQNEALIGHDSWRDFTSVATSHLFKIVGCDGVTYDVNVPPAPPDAWRESWRAMLKYLGALEKYSLEHRHICFPETEGSKRFTFAGVGLASYRYKIEKEDSLPHYVRKILQQLPTEHDCRAKKPAAPTSKETEQGVSWYDSLWEESFIAFRDYFVETGISAPPRGTYRNGINISNWIRTQRGIFTGTFTKHENLVSEERRARIEGLEGFSWEIPEDQSRGFRRWKTSFDLLAEFEVLNGHTRLSQSSHPSLYRWSHNQRTSYKAGNLSEAKIKLLESLETWKWD